MKQDMVKLVRLLLLVTLILAVMLISILAADQVALVQAFAVDEFAPNSANTGQVAAITSAHTLLLLSNSPNFLYLPMVVR